MRRGVPLAFSALLGPCGSKLRSPGRCPQESGVPHPHSGVVGLCTVAQWDGVHHLESETFCDSVSSSTNRVNNSTYVMVGMWIKQYCIKKTKPKARHVVST